MRSVPSLFFTTPNLKGVSKKIFFRDTNNQQQQYNNNTRGRQQTQTNLSSNITTSSTINLPIFNSLGIYFILN